MGASYHAPMRLFFCLSLLFIPSLSFGQSCTENTLLGPGNNFNCTTLTISSTGLNRSADGTGTPIIVTVTGDVFINGNVSVNGGDGFTIVDISDLPSQGGPGASRGGGISGNEGEPGGPNFPPDPEEGLSSLRSNSCENGGSGAGGFNTSGGSGLDCADAPAVTGGSAWGIFPLTRGGYGGGAGGSYDVASAFNFGSGGGGGGAIHIISTGGKITIASGVTISARGGNGGDVNSPGGAGGGGSGGVVLLDGALGVFNSGIIDVRGGRGGINSGTGGQGGAGGSGVYRIVNAGVTTEGTGITTSFSPKLKSDISCGTIAQKKDDNNLFLQVIAGFGIVFMIGLLNIFKNLFRFPRKI